MKKILLLIIIGAITLICSSSIAHDNHPDNNTTYARKFDSIAGASFGSKKSRIQFKYNSLRMKLSFNVKNYDDISGPTYELDSVINSNNAIYKNSKEYRGIIVKDKNTIQVTKPFSSQSKVDFNSNYIDMTFSPKGKDLGKRP